MIPKYRAWDKRQNVMRDVAVLHFTKSGKVNSIEYWKTPSELKSYHVRNIELMQSTGLKDKNGVEIFEGDIVLADGVKKIVTFGEQEHEEDFGDLIYYIGFNVYTKMGYSSVIPVEYEVIGNIWENSELLEEQR
ncbi:TPA: YopX family protein [Enterococcus hirae]|uniref:YopX protein domain-containing protein n=1 Tax=Enterococcus hirae TaxID=1354 RepID=A0AB37IAQ3_ENTHR|nr:YopX family protein [Enterococcus hirae]RBT47167.1 phage protein YopX [Enterococcus hirae]RBT52058.1 phage protein YopX [Enterococcus hirae]RBT52576.1 phage protein YopX [Enterococcus hirae]RBT56787.1 phage protein YopX [Enterococcus hirae]RBT57925.1 phage protein YopX [Enterococcus hirae]